MKSSTDALGTVSAIQLPRTFTLADIYCSVVRKVQAQLLVAASCAHTEHFFTCCEHARAQVSPDLISIAAVCVKNEGVPCALNTSTHCMQ